MPSLRPLVNIFKQLERGKEGKFAAHAVAECRQGKWHGTRQVRRDAQKGGALRAGFSKPRYIQMLQIANSPMQYLERVRRGTAAKIGALDERNGQPPHTRVPSRTCARDAAADDDEVEGLATKLRQRRRASPAETVRSDLTVVDWGIVERIGNSPPLSKETPGS